MTFTDAPIQIPDTEWNEDLVTQLEERIAQRIRREMIGAALGEDRPVTEEEAAHILGISPKELSRKRLAGEIPAGYIGRSPRYSIGILRRYSREIMEG